MRHVKDIFTVAVEHDPHERAAFLDGVCRGDRGLRREVDALLEAYDSREGFLDGGDDELEETWIGPYRLVACLGEGGFGVVYEAEQHEPVRRTVALKLLKPGMDSRRVIARFERERQAMALMDHPNIARVLDAGTSGDGRPYVVMDLVQGVPITEYCDGHDVDLEQRLRLFTTVCHAVQHAHQRGVIHRDLKPTNVLVALREGRPEPIVIDFGIAKAIEPGEDTRLTAERQVLGTPESMSPEQASGAPVDTRSDIYGLGVLLYQLLTGAPAHDRRQLRRATPAELQRIVTEDDPPRPSARLDDVRAARRVRGDLDWIVMKAIEKDPARRYESAAALALDVDRHLNVEPVLAGPPRTSYRLKKFARRHRAVMTTGIVLAIGLALGVSGLAAGFVRATQDRDAAVDARQEAEVARADAIAQRDEAERARAEAEAARQAAETVTDFLVDIFRAANPEVSGGRLMTVHDLLDEAGPMLGERFKDQPEIEVRIRHVLGESYLALGQYETAAMHLRAAADASRRALGDDHAQTLTALQALGRLALETGRLAEAEQLTHDVLASRMRLLGEEHPSTLESLDTLARLLLMQGRADEAEAVSRNLLDRRAALLGAEHAQTLESLSSLAQLSLEQGNYEEAISFLERTLDGQRSTFGDEHPATLSTLAQLAHAYQRIGLLEEAAALGEHVLQQRSAVLGREHPQTLASLDWLTQMRVAQEQLEEAEAMARELLETTRAMFTDDHPSTVRAIALYGRVMHLKEKFDESEAALTDALEQSMRLLGNEHPTTLERMRDLGRLYLDLGRIDESQSLAMESLEGLRRTLGDEHPQTVGALRDLARISLMRGETAQATALAQQAFESSSESGAIPDMRSALELLQQAYEQLGQVEEAANVREQLEALGGG